MKKTSFKKIIYLWAGINAAIAACLICLIIIPYSSKIGALKAEIQNNRQKIMEKEEQRLALIKAGQNYGSLAAWQSDGLDRIFISPDKIVEFIAGLEKLAADRQIAQRLDIGDTGIDEEKDYLSLSISAEGELENLIGYLEDLEKQDFYLIKEEVVMRRSVKPDTEGTSGALQITGIIYWLK